MVKFLIWCIKGRDSALIVLVYKLGLDQVSSKHSIVKNSFMLMCTVLDLGYTTVNKIDNSLHFWNLSWG